MHALFYSFEGYWQQLNITKILETVLQGKMQQAHFLYTLLKTLESFLAK